MRNSVRIRLDPKQELPTVRIGGVAGLPAVLRTLGADPTELLGELGIDLRLFDDPDNRIGFAARSRLLAHCVARTGCPHLGLLVGQQGGLEDLGLVGLLAKYSPDVGTALGSLVRHFHLHARGAALNLSVHDELVNFTYAVELPQTVATEQLGDGALASMLNVMRTLCGPGWTPSEVLLARRRPVDDRPYRRIFQAPLTFDARHNALLFSTRWLAHRLPVSDPGLERHLRKHIEGLESRYESFPDQVRSVLRTALLTRHAKADQVAALFSMHSRTLSRQLQACGTSYRDLLDEGRFEFARQMLENTALEVAQIAEALDYADASAFTRAFRRWSGTTPGQWRAERLSRPAR
jgi:AraC-like DNA-binding protein